MMPDDPPTTQARLLLRSLLGRGKRPACDIMAESERRGIPPWALRKAKAGEGVRSTREGFGPGSKVMWGHPLEEYRAWSATHYPSLPAATPPPPPCVWQGCADAPRSSRAQYCPTHARLRNQASKRRWKQRHAALLREATARLVIAMRRSRASVQTPPPVGPVGFLELVRAARQWLTLPEDQGAIRRALANLELLDRLLTGEENCPANRE